MFNKIRFKQEFFLTKIKNKSLFLFLGFLYAWAKLVIFHLTNLINAYFIRNICIVITNRCNAKCKMCDIWRTDKKSEIPLEKINSLSGTCLKKDFLTFIMGKG